LKGLIEMLKKHWQIVAVLIVLSGFGLGFRGCNDQEKKDFEKNLRTAVTIGAAAAVEVREEIKSYCRAELIKPESCAKAQPHADKIADIAGRIDSFQKAHPKLTPDNRGELLALIDDLLWEVDALEADGVIEFKDPEKRRNFLLGLAIGRSSVRVARVAVESAPLVQPSPSPSPGQ
jgi:hypothetical protein